jgi:DNA excision repair protein ERCC-3
LTRPPKELILRFECSPGICISTYNMVAYTGNRSEESKKLIAQIQSREWGLLIMDEVHVVPAAMFRKVISPPLG